LLALRHPKTAMQFPPTTKKSHLAVLTTEGKGAESR
jgi:hypothetical protein